MRRRQPHGAVLLDTCAVIWLANGDPMSRSAVSSIVQAGLAQGMYVSPVSAWEVGLLSRPTVGQRPGLRFLPDPKTWFAAFMAGPGVKEATLTCAIAIDASHLPGIFHADPGDRLIVATARHMGIPIVTRDGRIIDYARDGHARVVPC